LHSTVKIIYGKDDYKRSKKVGGVGSQIEPAAKSTLMLACEKF
jgi:hypothetical protein